MWGYPHMMPRNNFFSRTRPMPKRHGYGGWSWHGYFNWFDAQTPREEIFAGYTDRLCDFYWNVNQVDLLLEETTDPGVLRVTLETFTPELSALLVSVDDGPWQESPDNFIWTLHAGPNTLRAKTRNSIGTEGQPSIAQVDWTPA